MPRCPSPTTSLGQLKPRRLMSLRPRTSSLWTPCIREQRSPPPCPVERTNHQQRRLLLLKSLDVDSIHPRTTSRSSRGRLAPLGKLIVPLSSTGHRLAVPVRSLPAAPAKQYSLPDTPAGTAGDQLSNLPGPVDEQRQQTALELLLGIADSRPPQLYRSRTQRKPPGSAVSVPIAGIVCGSEFGERTAGLGRE